MKKTYLVAIVCIILIVVQAASAAVGDGICEVRMWSKTSSGMWTDAYAYISDGCENYKGMGISLWENDVLAQAYTRQYAYSPSIINGDTPNEYIPASSEVQAKTWFVIGDLPQQDPINLDEWSYFTPVYNGLGEIVSSRGSSTETGFDEYNTSTNVCYATPMTLSSNIGDAVEKSEAFITSFEHRVEKGFIMTLQKGDHMPNYCFDFENQEVIISVKKATGTTQYYATSWKYDEKGNIEWSSVQSVKK